MHSKWKDELNQNGYILCQKGSCGMGFLSLKGMETHDDVCDGLIKEGDFVSCTVCHVRFKTFLIMERHKAKTHRHLPLNRPTLDVPQQPHQAHVSRRSSSTIDLPNIFGDVDDTRVETAEDLRQRILAESRLISTGRRPGRPPKHPNQSKHKINLPKPPAIYRQRPQIDDRSRFSEGSFSVARPSNPPDLREEMVDMDTVQGRERALAMEEARLREYQERVLRYERLAEDATRVALEEKELRLKKLADELRQREIQAKQKLASAVQALEVMKSAMAVQAQPAKPSLPALVERRPSIIVAENEPDDVIDDDNEDEDEDEEMSEINDAPTTSSSPPAAKDRIHDDDQPEDSSLITVQVSDAVEDTDNGESLSSVINVDPEENMIVVTTDNAETLASLFDRANHGEVTLVAQAADDGNFILVDAAEVREAASDFEMVDESENEIAMAQSSSVEDTSDENEIVASQEESETAISTEEADVGFGQVDDAKVDLPEPSKAKVIDEPSSSEKLPKRSRRKTPEDGELAGSPRKTRNSSRFKEPEAVLSDGSIQKVPEVEIPSSKKRKSSRNPKLSFQVGLDPIVDEPNMKASHDVNPDVGEGNDAKKRKTTRNSRRSLQTMVDEPSNKSLANEGLSKSDKRRKSAQVPSLSQTGKVADEPADQAELSKTEKEVLSFQEPLMSEPKIEEIPKISAAGKRRKSAKMPKKPVVEKSSDKEDVTSKNKVARSEGLKCGKCDERFSSEHDRKVHVVNQHGGIDQDDLAENEILLALRGAFTVAKKVSCYRCNAKSYTTFMGLKYHVKTCGKSREELDALLLKCDHCEYRGLQSNLRMHMTNHTRLPEEKIIEEIEETYTASGRKRRSAASKASKRMSMVLESTTIDAADALDDDLEDSDDEFKIVKEGAFRLKKGKYDCQKCMFSTAKKEEIEKHVLDEHEDVEDEDIDDEGDEEVDPSSADEDDMDDIEPDEPDSKSGSSRKLGHRSSNHHGPKSLMDRFILKSEKRFRSNNYYANDFVDFNIPSQNEVIDNVEFRCKTSPKFAINGKDEFALKIFESMKHDGCRFSFFTGGPITASAWCPNEFFPQDILAICADQSYDPSPSDDTSIIQFWSFDVGRSPSFKAGICVDKVSSIHCLKWCPSLKEKEDNDPRLGLLAASCSDGTVKIFTVAKELFDSSSIVEFGVFMKTSPTLTLRRNGAQASECYKLDWYRGKHHRLVAATFSDGFVAIWDLLSKSPLLRLEDDDGQILPLHCFRAHAINERSSVVFSEHEDQTWPTYLITGSTERNLSLWNLTNPLGPSKEKHQAGILPITDMKWMSHYQDGCVSIAFDDAFFICNTRTIVVGIDEIGDKGNSQSILLQNSCVWSMDYSPLLNVTATSSSAGEVLLYIGEEEKSLQKLKNSKGHNTRRNYLFKSAVNVSRDDPSFLPTFQSLKDQYPDLTIDLQDRTMEAFGTLTTEETNMLKDKDSLPHDDFRKYPILSVNRVNFSPRMSSRSWIFAGSQSGLARLFHVPDFTVVGS